MNLVEQGLVEAMFRQRVASGSITFCSLERVIDREARLGQGSPGKDLTPFLQQLFRAVEELGA